MQDIKKCCEIYQMMLDFSQGLDLYIDIGKQYFTAIHDRRLGTGSPTLNTASRPVGFPTGFYFA